MLKQSLLVLSLVSLLGFVAINGLSVGDVLAQKNGWGKATSEEAGEDGKSFGAHASGQDDDPNGPGDAPFNDDGKPGRSGIGNVGDSDDNNLHPSDLGDLLDSIDCDDEDDTGSNC